MTHAGPGAGESPDASTRVVFLHGLEGSPRGRKASRLSACFDCRTPALDTRSFIDCVEMAATACLEHRPSVVVGSSFGGAVAFALRRQARAELSVAAARSGDPLVWTARGRGAATSRTPGRRSNRSRIAQRASDFDRSWRRRRRHRRR